MGDVLALEGYEGRESLRKAWGSRQIGVDPEIPEPACTEYIGTLQRTEGTETSKYLEEEKEKSIPSVAASESGTAQTTGVSLVGL
jgi:hypothetical protein